MLSKCFFVSGFRLDWSRSFFILSTHLFQEIEFLVDLKSGESIASAWTFGLEKKKKK